MERHLHRCLATVFKEFVRKWNTWYRLLRRRKTFSFADSVRYGLWLARG